MNQERQAWLRKMQAADLTNKEGRLQTYIEGQAAIWVPPASEVLEGTVVFNNIRGLKAATRLVVPEQRPEGEKEKYVCYPIPREWDQPVENSPSWSGRNKPLRLGLAEAGWKRRTKAKGSYLLEDLIDLSEISPEKVKRFVSKWGPLWLCFRHTDCFYGGPPASSQTGDYCQWFAAEPITAFQVRAQQAKAAFNIAASLIEGKPTIENDWRELGWHIEIHSEYLQALGLGTPAEIRELNPRGQRFLLTSTVNTYLSAPAAPHFWIIWGDAPRARLAVQYGLGFVRLAWLQIAQLITHATGYSTCANCTRFFIWHDVKPPRGKNNYCEVCGKRGAKKIWARSNRARKKITQ
jgi:hypothetical protein